MLDRTHSQMLAGENYLGSLPMTAKTTDVYLALKHWDRENGRRPWSETTWPLHRWQA